MDEADALEAIKRFVSGNISISELETEYGVTRKTFLKYIKRVLENPNIPQELKEAYIKRKAARRMDASVLGGKMGGRVVRLTEEEIRNIIQSIIDNSWTYREAEARLNISRTTLCRWAKTYRSPTQKEELEKLNAYNRSKGKS